MQETFVSAVISSYQSADTLARAVCSVLKQSYSNLEVVVVDNGSTDNTEEVIHELRRLDSRVHHVRLEMNQRPAGGRNAGVQQSRGEYIAFLDADDEWLPEKIQEQVWALDQCTEIGVVISDGWMIDATNESKKLYSSAYQKHIQSLILQRISADIPLFLFSEATRSGIYKKCFVNTSSVLMRKSLFSTIGGFDTRRFGTEDVDLWVRAAKHSRFAYLDAPRVNRYISGVSLSSASEKWLLELLSYHSACYSSQEYADLMPLIKYNLDKYYRYLIISSGRKRQIAKVCGYVKQSLSFGFFPMLFLLASLAPLGDKAYDLGLRLKALIR